MKNPVIAEQGKPSIAEGMLKFSCLSENHFNTLAQSGTILPQLSISKRKITVSGNGTEICNIRQLQGWAKRKTITQKMLLSLIDVAKKKGKAEQVKAYWNAYHCLNKTYSSEGRLYGKYCKNRFCTVCLCIRKAEILNKYLPVLRTWENPYFVTLTIKSVYANKLNYTITRGMIRGLKIIIEKYKKRNQRGKGNKLMGIKSLECNFNPATKTYNPHFHLIVNSKETADILISEWLRLWKNKWTNKAAQNSRKVENLERDLIECVKYGTKIFTEPDLNKHARQKVPHHIYVSALDNILTAMKQHRLFDRFGFKLPKSEKKVKSTQLNQYNEWIFDSKQCDWINTENEKVLAGYKLPIELGILLENNIDLLLQ